MDDSHPIGGKAGIRGHLQPETRRLLLDVLKEIDPLHRDVLWMHDAEGRPVRAIAAALSLPASTVLARLREARQRFQLAVAQMRRQSIPFAEDLPLSLADLQHEDGDGPLVPFGPSGDLLQQMALTLRVLNPISLAASLSGQDSPPDSAIRSRPHGPGKRPGPGGRV
jgi:hypothetical protein